MGNIKIQNLVHKEKWHFKAKGAMALQPLGKYLESKSDWMWVSHYALALIIGPGGWLF